LKNNKATGCDGIPAKVRKMLVIKDEGTDILMKLFNVIRNKREFPIAWKTALKQTIYKGKGNQRESSNYIWISLLPIFGKIYSGIIPFRLKEWLLHHKKLALFWAGFIEKKRNSR
jgi:hypothetical protein